MSAAHWGGGCRRYASGLRSTSAISIAVKCSTTASRASAGRGDVARRLRAARGRELLITIPPPRHRARQPALERAARAPPGSRAGLGRRRHAAPTRPPCTRDRGRIGGPPPRKIRPRPLPAPPPAPQPRPPPVPQSHFFGGPL